MNQKKAIGFGFRGWMLILFQAIAYITYQVFTQYPLNILADFYGGATVVSRYYSICAVVGIFIQLLLVGPISRLKNLKAFCCTLGGVSLVLAFFVMTQPAGPLWYICYSLINVTSVLYATMTLGLLVGQWFPTRKGTVMGIERWRSRSQTVCSGLSPTLCSDLSQWVWVPTSPAHSCRSSSSPLSAG